MRKTHSQWLVLAASTLTLMALTALSPVLNLIREDLNLTASHIGFLVTVYAGFVALSSPFVGIAIDKRGPKVLLVTGLLVYGLSGGAGIFIDSYLPLVASRAVLGIAVAAIFSGVSVIIGQNYHGKDLQQMMGLRVSINDFAAVIWPVIGGGLGALSWHAPFAIFLISIPLSLAVLKWVPKSPAQARVTGTNKKVTFRTIISHQPALIADYALIFMTGFVVSAMTVYLPPLLEQTGVSDTFTIGLYVSAFTLSIAVVSLLYGRIKTFLGYRAMAIIAVTLWSLGFAIIVLVPGKATILIAALIIGLGPGLTLPASLAWASEIGPENLRGRITSNAATFAYLGIFLTPLLLAPVEILISLSAIFVVLNLVFVIILAALVLVTFVKRVRTST